MTEGHDADTRPVPDHNSAERWLPALAVVDGGPRGALAEQVANDLAIVIAFQEVMQRRGFADSHATRHHLEELLRVLAEGARSKQEGGL